MPHGKDAAFTTPSVTVYQGDVLDVLRDLPDESVDCVVTSPPYWGLRDYGTAKWSGGDPECKHAIGRMMGNANKGHVRQVLDGDRDTCRCGASRVDSQIGLERTPSEYVEKMVAVFREVRRVLSGRGTLWLNLGDSYAAQGGGKSEGQYVEKRVSTWQKPRSVPGGLKPKDLVGIPWRVAFALQADGWYLRSDIIWAKPNPMPESVTDRPTKSHEYIYLLSKNERYYYDADAIREDAVTNGLNGGAYSPPGQPPHSNARKSVARGDFNGKTNALPGREAFRAVTSFRNARSVWTIATTPYPEAHFAVFPRELPERAIKAGCPERVCETCGKPSERIVERERVPLQRTYRGAVQTVETMTPQGVRWGGDGVPSRIASTTTGWTDCGHGTWRPGIVLDPFAGSGTTLAVARDLARKSIGIELNPEYVRLIERRVAQLALDLVVKE